MAFYSAGNILAVDMGLYWHKFMASDRIEGGRQFVIENSKQAGLVREVPLQMAAEGRKVIDLGASRRLPVATVLARARSRIGSRYSLDDWNCEHFVAWAQGHRPASPQLVAASVAAGAAILVLALAWRNR